ncbi:MAG: nucleotidyltransferase family protein [Proteobacteria bacterium]|nr:nucleotidyltransferase family protein [Pseudomonadota bacterium]
MIPVPQTAMVLAAGLGQRMRPLSLEKPKPLLEVDGRTMLDLVLDRLAEAGVKKAVVNTHYKAWMIESHLQLRRDVKITFSREEELLDTGGGVKKALPHLGKLPIFVVNSDLPWQNGATPALARLAAAFDEKKMDALLLLAKRENPRTRGFTNAEGDFFMEDGGRLRRLGTNTPRPYVFISAQIVKPEIFARVPEKVFSTNQVWDEAERNGRLYGLAHDGACYHVGTPADLVESNRLLREGGGW